MSGSDAAVEHTLARVNRRLKQQGDRPWLSEQEVGMLLDLLAEGAVRRGAGRRSDPGPQLRPAPLIFARCDATPPASWLPRRNTAEHAGAMDMEADKSGDICQTKVSG
jgi:hypothetical protein